jgi:hypothetical protein
MFEALESRALFSTTLMTADAPVTDTATPTDTTVVVAERDAASGLPTGKRMHKPLVITMEMDKATPTLM